MIHDQDQYYPGSGATDSEVLGLANEFREAALVLLSEARESGPCPGAPARFCAIHAIELYLNAFLQRAGETPASVRARHHDLAARADLAVEKGLVLRRKTAEHLKRMTDAREYLVLRSGPELTSVLSQQNRLIATLNEVADKVNRANCRAEIALPSPAARAAKPSAAAPL
jgi:hypothetical protein